MSYFKVGEEVILQSTLYPELNGDCIVTDALESTPRVCHFANGINEISSGRAYYTTISNSNNWPWSESALRKKHKPSTESLSSMIAKLNVKSKVESK
jgi:hypothetical protein